MIDNKGIKITDKHVFFWGGWPSNWFKSTIILEDYSGRNLVFPTSEHLFMWRKSMFFNDKEIAEKILATTNPRDAKNLGRKVKGFDNVLWDTVKYDIMFTANFHKYNQNKELCSTLLSPLFEGKTFVEASPYDKVWGIGMSMDDDGVDDESNWKGENLLGKVITSIRHDSTLAKMLYSK